uniref:Uncharacterized protein n=1 Tax=Panagrolaimus sp. JU765 TaxID=591449 RepID=A0AC34R0G7_9BILA
MPESRYPSVWNVKAVWGQKRRTKSKRENGAHVFIQPFDFKDVSMAQKLTIFALFAIFSVLMEQLQEEPSTLNLSDDWQKLDPKEVLKLLNLTTLNAIVSFAKSSSEAKSFVISNRDRIVDLNPISLAIEDIFPTDEDNVYQFVILARIGHVNASGNDEESVPAKTESELREILQLFAPVDFVEVKMTFPNGFEDDIAQLIGRPLEFAEDDQLKRVGYYRQAKRKADKKLNFLARHGLSEEQFTIAKDDVLRHGNPTNMSTDVYDTAITLEEGERELIFQLNMLEHTGPVCNVDRSVAMIQCARGDAENVLC